MNIKIKKSINIFLLITMITVAFAFDLNSDKGIVQGSEIDPFTNVFNYDMKDINDLTQNELDSFVRIDDLYNVVSGVNVNQNYYGKTDFSSDQVTNGKIIQFIELFQPNYIAKTGDWVISLNSNGQEILFEYNGIDWINQGLFTLDLDIKNQILNLVDEKIIAIENSNDLFRLGNMASINFDKQGGINSYIFVETIKTILSLNYQLLGDIDYSDKKAQRFVPLGTNIELNLGSELIKYYMPFTGTFNGNGFTIKNLFLADYSYISTTFQDTDASTAITSGIFEHYSMFSVVDTSGVIKNLILENPNYDLIVGDELAGLYKTSVLVGLNKGTIYNVSVIDQKKNQLGLDNEGISFRIPLASIDKYTAAGFVHDNEGLIYNSFFASKRILSANSTNGRFDQIEAFVLNNTGILSGVSYQVDVLDLKDSQNDSLVPSYTKEEYYQGDNINLNSHSYDETERYNEWYFYKDDGYPSLFGLVYDNNNYLINNEYDLVIFAKLLKKISIVNGKAFNEHSYLLTDDINMNNIKGFKAIERNFKGKLSSQGSTKYIYNLNIDTPFISGDEYYISLFSKLSGTIENINFLNNSLTVTNSNYHYGKTIYVGMIAGKLDGGTIKNVYVNTNIDLGTEALGITYTGGLVGLGKGTIENTGNVLKDNFGGINGNTHNFDNRSIKASYYIGGLIGANNGIIGINNSFNEVDIKGVNSSNGNYSSQINAKTFTGGIIGELTNDLTKSNSLLYLTNSGEISSGLIHGKENLHSEAYSGGIFASTKNYGYKLNNNKLTLNGRLENKGKLTGKFVNENTKIYAAGIGVMNTSEDYAKVSYMINKGTFDFQGFNYQTANNTIYYASTIIDKSTGGIELSRAYNTTNYSLGELFFDDVIGAVNSSEIKISLFFNSVNDIKSKLLFVENMGDLTIGSETRDININKKLKISNITQATRVDYQNVINSGDINVLRLQNKNINETNGTENSIYVAGVSWILPYDNRAYTMKNVLNEGKIITAGMKSDTKVISVTGERFADSSFDSNINVKNIYVAGIVNLNVGEITNSFNTGTITSTYSENLKDINGTANTFVGGINTFNYNLIKNVANTGLIEYTNSSSQSVSHFSATKDKTGTNNSTFGGISIAYTGGVVTAGIVAALGDISGTELTDYKQGAESVVAEVVDTVNDGDIYAKAKEYTRSAGVLAIALSVELTSGTFKNNSETSNTQAGPFTTAVIGSGDPVGKSLLSNGLNYGNIYAVTHTVGSYGNNNELVTVGTSTTETAANVLRPGINAASGGIISYGLTKMIRMLNHGVISSTDVAGGIVGATYILGRKSNDPDLITEVDISTAVHYGQIKAIKIGQYNNQRKFITDTILYENFKYQDNDNFNNNQRFYQLNEYNDYIYYGASLTNHFIETYQQARRGFGGIFGRLQRGNSGTMQAKEFKNVMNMDQNIDLVGRVDSNISGSLTFYRFFTGNESYFTAKEKDTSPNAFVGWKRREYIRYEYVNADVEFTVKREGEIYYLTDIRVINKNGAIEARDVTKAVRRPTGSRVTYETVNYMTPYSGYTLSNNTNSTNNYRVQEFGLTQNDYGTINYNQSKTFIKNNYTYHPVLRLDSGSYGTTNPGTSEASRYPIKHVTDNPNFNALNIFDKDYFSLMSPENSEYIYAVEEDALSSRFKTGGINAKPFGMYVLSSSTGSIDGASLPTNIQISDLYRIYENINETTHLDLDDIKLNQLILPDENNHDSILYKYKNMFQLSYNNKSEILAEDENSTPKIAELVLDDPTGNSPRLSGGIIDRTTSPQTITYNVSQSAFNNLNQVNYEVVYSELSKGATLGSVESSTTPWDWNISYPFSGNQAKKIIRVYSEININGGLAGKYYTDYEIIINVSNINLNMDAVISVDNSQENVSQISDSYIFNTSLGTMSPNGHITALFSGYGPNDNQRNQMDSLIANGHNLVVKGVYIDSIDPKSLIDPEFYSIDLISKGSINTNANQFGFKVTLSDQLKTGDYLIEYSYYETSVNKTIKFTKRESTNIDFIDMYYDYFSSDENNENYDFVRTNELEFTTYIEFGYLFSDILNVNQRYNLNVDIINKNNYEDYVYDFDISHYNLSLNGMELLTNIQISPFATINSASMEFEYTPNGLRKYILRYFVEPESGTELEVKQTIIERELTNTNVYLDDNLQTSNNFKVTREAILSQIRVDFNLLDSDMYNQIIMHVNNDIHKDNDEVYIIDNDDEYLFGITYIQDPGSYTYNFIIERDSVPYTLGEVIILKDKGVSAYLIDVKYEGLDGGTIFKYPTINPTDEFGNVIDNYDTRFYPGGIDYLDLEGQVYNFKINSEVSDIDLEHYSPGFILPYGARIQRMDRLNGWTMPTSDVNDDSLKTDYIGFDDFSEEVITYRVIPEENADGDYSNSVTYFISAEDMEYNLTIRFKIYYRDPVLGIIDANSENSPIKNNIVLINLMNLKLDQVYPVVGDGNLVANYPNLGSNSFTGINNQSSLYYFLNKDKDVNYRFGRNKTGAYNFNILSPRYLGTETSDLKPNERYKYSMFMVPKDSNNNNWDNSENQLPAMNDYLSDSSGLFYYVYSPTTNPITRELAIVINPETVDKKWGIYDDYGSFN